jgi:general transcription factor 3C polypeptide 3 (transcription factor C subunit 4)
VCCIRDADTLLLWKDLAPAAEDEEPAANDAGRIDHRGIPFGDWLDLFLEYAIALAQSRRPKEAYEVCQAARDAFVYQSKENMFLIHLTWASMLLIFSVHPT